jgi:hypothetical protein
VARQAVCAKVVREPATIGADKANDLEEAGCAHRQRSNPFRGDDNPLESPSGGGTTLIAQLPLTEHVTLEAEGPANA